MDDQARLAELMVRYQGGDGLAPAQLGDLDHQIEANGMLPSVAEISDIPVKVQDGATVYVRDVGHAEDTAQLQSNVVRVDGRRRRSTCPSTGSPAPTRSRSSTASGARRSSCASACRPGSSSTSSSTHRSSRGARRVLARDRSRRHRERGLSGSSAGLGIPGMNNSPLRRHYGAGLEARIPIWDFGRTLGRVRHRHRTATAAALVERRAAALADVEQSLWLEVALAHQATAEELELARAYEEESARAERAAAGARASYQAGLLPYVEVARASLAVADAHARRESALRRRPRGARASCGATAGAVISRRHGAMTRKKRRFAAFFGAALLLLSAACKPEAARGDQRPATPETSLPGAPPLPAAVAKRLRAALVAPSARDRPRTRHRLPGGGPRYTNRLLLETSPYLRQHAHNPVNWYPWGDEAFAAARRLGRPVLLSVGYSTCHWCHVMEEESFDDVEVARVLNEQYVAIKVDREERPDVDAIYMVAVQALTGSGGWPMTVWLTPERRPFFAGTYFPARDGDRGAPTGFLSLLRKLRAIYASDRARVASSAAALVELIGRQVQPTAAGVRLPRGEILDRAAATYRAQYDEAQGGLRGPMKFPSSLPVRFLLRHYRRSGDTRSLRMATVTLQRMAAGGIRDHLGGGFHRYSTDARWLVPHFEKMLYDNALLVAAYLEAHQATGREEFAAVARDTLQYVLRDMTSTEGAFFTASDADSPDGRGALEEGAYYTWTAEEMGQVLGEKDARVARAYFRVSPAGHLGGRSVLHLGRPAEGLARELGLGEEALRASIQSARAKLLAARAGRPPPHRDEKVLVAWNGLMVSALAKAALVLGDERYARSAVRAADFVLTRMQRNGRLLRSYTDGEARHPAYLEDYAFFIAGLLDLYESTGGASWLAQAIALDRVVEQRYEDQRAGGFFRTSDDHERLLAREKPATDGAEPSGASVQVLNLLRLHELTTRDSCRARAERALGFFGSLLDRSPTNLSEMLLALDFFLDVPKEIVIVTPSRRSEAEPLLSRLRRTYLPNRVVVVTSERELVSQERLVPLVEGKVARRGKATAYVCERSRCELPTDDPETFARQLRKVSRRPERR